MLVAAAFGPVLARPGKQLPLPSGPPGTCAVVVSQAPVLPPPAAPTLSVRAFERAFASNELPRKVARTV